MVRLYGALTKTQTTAQTFLIMLLQDTNLRINVFLHHVFGEQHQIALECTPQIAMNCAPLTTGLSRSDSQMLATARDPTDLIIFEEANVRNFAKGSIGKDHDNIEQTYSIEMCI